MKLLRPKRIYRLAQTLIQEKPISCFSLSRSERTAGRMFLNVKRLQNVCVSNLCEEFDQAKIYDADSG